VWRETRSSRLVQSGQMISCAPGQGSCPTPRLFERPRCLERLESVRIRLPSAFLTASSLCFCIRLSCVYRYRCQGLTTWINLQIPAPARLFDRFNRDPSKLHGCLEGWNAASTCTTVTFHPGLGRSVSGNCRTSISLRTSCASLVEVVTDAWQISPGLHGEGKTCRV
jgi:hypothetical protein